MHASKPATTFYRDLIVSMLVAVQFAVPSLAQTEDPQANTQSGPGVAVSLIYDGDFASNLAGGARRASTYTDVAHVQVSMDGDRLLGWTGTTAFIDATRLHGGNPSEIVGDAQGVNNIAGPSASKIYEAWLQYNGPGSRFSVLAGRYDLNTEFYRLASASLFINSSFGIGPEFSQSGVAGPSIFPNTSVGLRLTFKPMEGLVLRSAVLDGVPLDRPAVATPGVGADGLLLVSEAAFLGRPGPATPAGKVRSMVGRASSLPPYDDKIALGAWYYTATFDDLSRTYADGAPVRHGGSRGGYLVADKLVYRAPGEEHKIISAFAQAGFGDERVNRFGSYAGFGIVAAGFVPQRAKDEIGIAVARAQSGAHYVNAQSVLGLSSKSAEIAAEITYVSQLTAWLAVRPDIQYVVNPNTNPMTRNAWVFQFVLEFTL